MNRKSEIAGGTNTLTRMSLSSRCAPRGSPDCCSPMFVETEPIALSMSLIGVDCGKGGLLINYGQEIRSGGSYTEKNVRGCKRRVAKLLKIAACINWNCLWPPLVNEGNPIYSWLSPIHALQGNSGENVHTFHHCQTNKIDP